jgi:hypothetical protein
MRDTQLTGFNNLNENRNGIWAWRRDSVSWIETALSVCLLYE